MDMEEEKTDKELFIQEEIWEFAEAVRFGKKKIWLILLTRWRKRLKELLWKKPCLYLPTADYKSSGKCM